MSYLPGALEIRQLFGLDTTESQDLDSPFLQHEALHGLVLSHRRRYSGKHSQQDRDFFLQAVAYQMRCSSLLKKLSESVPEVPLVAFKGCSLSIGLYQEAGQRTFGDVDIAAPEVHHLQIGQVLQGFGFSRSEVSGEYVKNGLTVDLHKHPLEKLEPLFQPEARLWWTRLRPLSEVAGRTLRLSYEDEFVLVLVHGVKHSFSRLNWLVDLALLARRCDPEVLTRSLDRHRAWSQMAYAQALMLQFYGIEVLPAWRSSRPFDWLERKFLRKVADREPAAFLGKLLSLRSAPSWSVAGMFLGKNLFPEDSTIRQRVSDLVGMLFSLVRK